MAYLSHRQDSRSRPHPREFESREESRDDATGTDFFLSVITAVKRVSSRTAPTVLWPTSGPELWSPMSSKSTSRDDTSLGGQSVSSPRRPLPFLPSYMYCTDLRFFCPVDNYILATAFGAAIPLCGIFLFLSLFNSGLAPVWWGVSRFLFFFQLSNRSLTSSSSLFFSSRTRSPTQVAMPKDVSSISSFALQLP